MFINPTKYPRIKKYFPFFLLIVVSNNHIFHIGIWNNDEMKAQTTIADNNRIHIFLNFSI